MANGIKTADYISSAERLNSQTGNQNDAAIVSQYMDAHNGKSTGVPLNSAAQTAIVQYKSSLNNPTTDTGSNSGGTTGGGGTSGGGSSSGGSAQSIYENYLQQILADQQAASQARQQALQENYNRALATLQQNHNEQMNNLKNSADDSLRQAYISYMKGQKGINQQLSNQGINGGATESILANLYNNYGSNRNSIQNQLQQSMSELGANYNTNVADLANTYGSNLADVLADYYNSASSTKENYANKIASLLASSSKSSGSGSGSSSSSSSTSANNPFGVDNYIYEGILALNDRINKGTATTQDLANQLNSVGLTYGQKASILANLGYNAQALGITDGTTGTSLTSGNGGNGSGSSNSSNGLGVTMDGTNYARSGYDYNTALNDLKRIRSMGGSNTDNLANQYANNLMTQYGITQAEAIKLLQDAGIV